MNTLTKPIAYADFRGTKKPERECGGCRCQTRSHFFVCDNGDIYNVDTKGFIWYCANSSSSWKKIYKCRNYIPWQPYISRLDHVGRDDFGRAGDFRNNTRIPCGRPMSGNFCGFQTDIDSCVLFKNGQKVYEGKYVSDCDGAIGFNNQNFQNFHSYSIGTINNYLTDTGCNNNKPVGNSDPLYRNIQGTWNESDWSFTPNNTFVHGEVTPMFSAVMVSDEAVVSRDVFGWSIGTSAADCCGNSIYPDHTGFHLGTNETGSTVWFTRERTGTTRRRFAGRVASINALPNVVNLKDWQVVDEQGEPKSPSTLQDHDIIAITTGTDFESLWAAPCYYLKDFQWHEAGTYQVLVMQKGVAAVFHDSAQPITSCKDTPDCWIGNAQSIQSCGDVCLINSNQKGVDRIILLAGKVVAQKHALPPSADVVMNDTIACVLSKHYFSLNDLSSTNCEDKDGIAAITLTNEDGTYTLLIMHGTANSWSITHTETTETPWTGLNAGYNGQPDNCHWAVLERSIDGGTSRLILYKGMKVVEYQYQYSWYTRMPPLPTGVTDGCEFSYICPSSSGIELASVWDSEGNSIISCARISWVLRYEVYYLLDESGRAITETESKSTSYESYSVNSTTCERTLQGTNTLTTTCSYIKNYWTKGGVLYDSAGWNIQLTSYSGRVSYITPNQGGEAAGAFYESQSFNGYRDQCVLADWMCNDERVHIGQGHTYKRFLKTKPALVSRPYSYEGGCQSPMNCKIDTKTVEYIDFYYMSVQGAKHITRTGTIKKDYIYSPKNVNMTCNYRYIDGVSVYDCVQSQTTCDVYVINLPSKSGNPPYTPYSTFLGTDYRPQKKKRFVIAPNVVYDFEGNPPAMCWWDQQSLDVIEIPNVIQAYSKTIYGSTEITQIHYVLEAGKEYYKNPDDYMSAYSCGESWCYSYFKTHIITAVFDVNPAYLTRMCALKSLDHTTETVDIDPAVIEQTDGYGSRLCTEERPCLRCNNPNLYFQKTAHYKNCKSNKVAYGVCGYLLQYIDNENWELSFGGSVVYSGNINTTTYECCATAYALMITESAETTVTKSYFVEGNLIWSTTYQQTDDEDASDTIRSLQCCGSQSIDETRKPLYRYALLIVNKLKEDLVDYNGEWFRGTSNKPVTCDYYPQYDPQLEIDAMSHADEYTITLTDGTIATPTHCTADWLLTLGGTCMPYCWYDEYTTSDGVVFGGLYNKGFYHGGLDGDWRIINTPIYDNMNLAKRHVYETGSGRQCIITCNGSIIASNKNYEGIHCCGDYMLAAYIDDEYKSGWHNQVDTGDPDFEILETRHVPFPAMPRPDAEEVDDTGTKRWNIFNAMYSDYKVDVFFRGVFTGTYAVNDFNSPLHYDHVGMQYPWTIQAINGGNARSPNVGTHPECMEGNPVCLPMNSLNDTGTVVVPHNDSLMVLRGAEGIRHSFGVRC